MSYMHIDNLYREQRILLFRECFALEKIHGTSVHIRWRAHDDTNQHELLFSSGGAKRNAFLALFDEPKLRSLFAGIGHPDVVIYGEAYGGSMQKQAWRYGDKLRFVAFEVKVGDCWLSVPQAHDFCNTLGLEFVHYTKVSTSIEALNTERDAPSEQAKRNGVEGDKPREGVVLRPLIELVANDGSRIMSKHKRDEERETATTRDVVDPAKLEVLTRAADIATEWATPTRLEHVLDKLGHDIGIERTKDVIVAMIADILREGAGEIVDSREARTAIGTKTATMFKARIKAALQELR